MEIEALERKLDKQISWRKKEILTVKADALIAQGTQQTTLLRCLTVLSYAHWEGFVKEAAIIYFEFIMSKNMTYAELDESLVAIAISKRANSGTVRPSYYHDVTCFLRHEQNDRAQISTPSVLSDMGLLTSERLEVILYCLAMKLDPFALKLKWLDYSFISTRNKIAHGVYTPITSSEIQKYFEFSDDALALLETFKTEVINSASSRTYVRQPILPIAGERL